jgi:hypothetical protein
MKQTTARGLSFYCQTEEVMNILRENERFDEEIMIQKYGPNWKEEMATQKASAFTAATTNLAQDSRDSFLHSFSAS